ncbi:MAG: hypothetical protein ACD_77C00391G0001 [uncultured bacterium]|nr:MAG: hypothetical protein ACD_77C00391G0001 [uncultured bacterium]HBY02589.1 hypothetical protein [Rikenellaceae bacterium]
MHVIHDGRRSRNGGMPVVLTAAILIAAGLIFLARNLELIDYNVFRIFISWQMLLIVLGLNSIFKKQLVGGGILIGVGLFFLIPRITGLGYHWVGTYWPILFVLIGIMLLFKLWKPGTFMSNRAGFGNDNSFKTADGFITSNNAFGSVNQIFLDPVFKGARISNTFGSTLIDLRRTSLEAPETYIDIDCSFGGIEIFVPHNWTVKSNLHHFFSGNDDKRFWANGVQDTEHKLIIRGNISFSGVEIKS